MKSVLKISLLLLLPFFVKAHGGELKVETKEGEGTTFFISLPVNN